MTRLYTVWFAAEKALMSVDRRPEMEKLYSPKEDELAGFKVLVKGKGEDTYHENVYSLNPPAANISFFSQQRRGCWLGSKIAESHDRKNVLIVGGGLSGATCYFTMRALGHENVWLYEAKQGLLQTQKNAAHRYAHPSLAEWPLANSFSSTTDLALMNWYAGPVHEVIERISKELTFETAWNSWEGNIHFGLVVVGLQEINDNGNRRWRVETNQYQVPNDGQKNEPPEYFDVVILATGFGTERGAAANNSEYWEYDYVRRIREDPKRFGPREWVVVGGGDAALIDAARLCLGEKAEALSLEQIHNLRHDQHKKFHTGFVDFQKSEPEIEFAKIFAAQKTFSKWYKEVNQALLIKGQLDQARCDAGDHRTPGITLLCPSEPTENPGNAAPINVLMYKLLRSPKKKKFYIDWKPLNKAIDFQKDKEITINNRFSSGMLAGRMLAGRRSIPLNSPDHTFVFRCGCEPDGLEIGGQPSSIRNAPGGNLGPLVDGRTVIDITRGILAKHLGSVDVRDSQTV